jgi:hypothetical protein
MNVETMQMRMRFKPEPALRAEISLRMQVTVRTWNIDGLPRSAREIGSFNSEKSFSI